MLMTAVLPIAQAAELSLKLVLEEEKPNIIAPEGHDLHKLYQRLSPERREKIETEYAKRIAAAPRPTPKWATAAETFKTERNSFVEWRYFPQTGFATHPTTIPAYLLEAAKSVFLTLPYAGKLLQGQLQEEPNPPPDVRRKFGLDMVPEDSRASS